MNNTLASAFSIIILMYTTLVWAAPVPDTGQTKCYNNTDEIPCPSPGQPFFGQDANYNINPMSYTKLDGSGNALSDSATSWAMVRDNVTGLIWEVKTNKDGTPDYNNHHDADNLYTWYINGGVGGTPGIGTDTQDFIDALNAGHFGGFSEWRLPTQKELANLINHSIPEPGPAINIQYFQNTTVIYWSSNIVVYSTEDRIWCINFTTSKGTHIPSYIGYSVRAVRGGLAETFVDNYDGTITDLSTGLMWQKDSPENAMVWDESLAYCENLSLGGCTDWRMPNIKELHSIVDYNRYNPAININFFQNMVNFVYWSSTTSLEWNNSALGVYFKPGYDIAHIKSTTYNRVRAVRGGQPEQRRGDVNGDNNIDLTDAIIVLKVLAGLEHVGLNLAADVDGDGKIGMAEAIYALQKVAGL